MKNQHVVKPREFSTAKTASCQVSNTTVNHEMALDEEGGKKKEKAVQNSNRHKKPCWVILDEEVFRFGE